MRTPRAVTPLRYEYLIVGNIVRGYNIFAMTQKEFVDMCMKDSGGHFNPNRAKELYMMFMEDAGLSPLYGEEK